jgi:hypothetical protein
MIQRRRPYGIAQVLYPATTSLLHLTSPGTWRTRFWIYDTESTTCAWPETGSNVRIEA